MEFQFGVQSETVFRRISIPSCCNGSNAAFEAESGGSIPSEGANFNALIAQLDRASDYGSEG